MKKFAIALLLLIGVLPASAATYFISPTGSDANSGTSSGAPWLTPNHALNCGDVISAAAGTYSGANFGEGNWGTVSCPGNNNVAWLKCATFDSCKINSTTDFQTIWIDKSYWGVQGWEVTVGSPAIETACFQATPNTTTLQSIHHIIFANNVANGCEAAGFGAYNQSKTASVDYLVIVGNIAYNGARGTNQCGSGISVYQPIASDTASGTHIFISGNFSYNNFNPATCAGGPSTDGEGIIVDTLDFSQGGGTAYTQQVVVDNNIVVDNGSFGIEAFNNQVGAIDAPTYFRNNTVWGNLKDPNQSKTGAGEISVITASATTVTGNIAQATAATGLGGHALYALSMSGGDSTDTVYNNFATGVSGNNTFLFSSGSFAYDSNTLGTSPAFSAPANPAAPSCGSATSVPNCMASVISNFRPTASGSTAFGYHTPGSTSIVDALYPAWLCNVSGLPTGLVTPGCTAANVTSITILPDATNGYTNTINTTAQLAALVCYSSGPCDNGAAAGGIAWSSPNPATLITVDNTGKVTIPAYNNIGTAAFPASPVNGQVVWITNPSAANTCARAASAGNLAIPCTYSTVSGNSGWQPSVNDWVSAKASNGVVGVHQFSIFGYLTAGITSTWFTPLPSTETQYSPTLTDVVGGKVLMNASFNTPSEGNGAYWNEDSYAAWSASPSTVCTIDPTGTLTGVAAGTCTVTAKWQGHTQSTTVAIVAPTNTGTGANCPSGSGITYGTCWFIRPAGGPRFRTGLAGDSCNGKADADMTIGGGPNQACAFSHLEYIDTDDSNNGALLQYAISPGDTVIVRGGPYSVGEKCTTAGKLVCGFSDPHAQWGYKAATIPYSNGLYLPSGPTGHPTQVLGENWKNCGLGTNNQTKLIAYLGGHWDMRGTQNVSIQCIEQENSDKCLFFSNPPVNPPYPVCPSSGSTRDSRVMIVDNMTGGLDLEHDFFHGFNEGMTGGIGPGFTVNDLRLYRNNNAGTNFDDPNGYNTQAAGLSAQYLDIEYAGFTEEYPIQKPVTSATCDGAGNETVTFAQNENFVHPGVSDPKGNTIILSGFTPSSYNTPTGTKANVTSSTWTNQSLAITGGLCVDHSASTPNGMSQLEAGRFKSCNFQTSTPAFGIGDTVVVSGSSPTWLNTAWLVQSTSSTGFRATAAMRTGGGGSINTQFTTNCDGNWSATTTYATGQIVWYSAAGNETGSYYISLTSSNLNNNPATSGTNWAVTTSGICNISGGTVGTERTIVVANSCGSAGSATTAGTAQHPNPAYFGWDQGTSGYGDGLGTANTTGAWDCDHCTAIGNTQDGFDLLHSFSKEMSFTNSTSFGNQGQSLKLGLALNGTLKNDVLIANCGRNGVFDPDKPPTAHSFINMVCRAADGVPIGVTAFSTINISGNTFVSSQSDEFALTTGVPNAGTDQATIEFHNNIVMGFYDTALANILPAAGFVCEGGPCPAPNNTNSLYFNVKNNSTICTSAHPTWLCSDPLLNYEIGNPASTTPPCASTGGLCLTNEVHADQWNFLPKSGSPVIGAGVAGYDLSTDYAGIVRSNPPSIGALEFAAPSIYTLSVNTTPTGTGSITGCAGSYTSGTAYSCTVTVPSGWQLVSVTGCGGSGTTTYSGTMPASNCTVSATFVQLFTLTPSTLGTGTIAGCAGNFTAGTPYTCTITPGGGGWTISSVTGCGGSGTTTYAGTMPAANCTVMATFSPPPPPPASWLLTIGIAGSGTVTGCGGMITQGLTVTCTVTPATGFTAQPPITNCGSLTQAGNNWSFTMPTNACVFTEFFTQPPGITTTNGVQLTLQDQIQ